MKTLYKRKKTINSQNDAIAILGGTGLLGRELVSELIASEPNRKIYLLIRAKSEEHKALRFNEIMSWIFDSNWADSDRFYNIIPIRADMDLPTLGLSLEDQKQLHSVADFFCLASSTSFNLTLEQARIKNVISLERLIKLLKSKEHNKSLRYLHYVSTAFVANSKNGIGLETPVDLNLSHRNTYERSKAEAEALLASSEIPHRIYRPSIIVGSSKSGRAANFSTIYIGLKAIFDGLLPACPCGPEVTLDIVPSDYVANVIAKLSASTSEKQIFNICAGNNTTTIGEVIDIFLAHSKDYCSATDNHKSQLMSFLDEDFINRLYRAENNFAPLEIKKGIKKIKIFIPFLSKNVQRFDNSNTIGLTGELPPKFNEYANLIYSYAIDKNFGHEHIPKQIAVHKKEQYKVALPKQITYNTNAYKTNPFAHLLCKNAAINTNQLAIKDLERSITHGELFQECFIMLDKLQSANITPGMKVELLLDNSIDSAILLLACILLQTQSLLSSPDIKTRSINWSNRLSVQNGELKINTGNNSKLKIDDSLLEEFRGEIIIATSGTTGQPKLVRHSFESILYSAEQTALGAGLKKSDHLLLAMPLFHAFAGLIVLPAVLFSGACLELTSKASLIEIAQSRATHFVGISKHFGDLIGEYNASNKLDLSNWNIGICGDDYLSPVVRKTFEQVFMRPLTQGYGLTEALVISLMGRDPRHENSVGKPISGVEVVVVDKRGTKVPAGTNGEICVRGRTLMSGYLGQTKMKTVPGGYIRTGDIGYVDEKGYLYIKGRQRCSPFSHTEILMREGQLLSSASISEKLRLDNTQQLQVLFDSNINKAFIFTDRIGEKLAYKSQELFQHLNLEYELIVIDEWPLTPVGKISRYELSKRISLANYSFSS